MNLQNKKLVTRLKSLNNPSSLVNAGFEKFRHLKALDLSDNHINGSLESQGKLNFNSGNWISSQITSYKNKYIFP